MRAKFGSCAPTATATITQQVLGVIEVLVCVIGFVLSLAPFTFAQETRKPRNQLGDLFRNLDRGIRRGAEDLKNKKSARDQLDTRPVQRPEDNRRLQQATDLIEQGRWREAAEVLQYLLDQPTDAFSIDDAREFHSMQSEVDRLIAGLPAEGLRNYVNHYAVTAAQLLDQAIAEQSETLLTNVSRHYFSTPAGRTALEMLARNWQDQGEFGLAAEAWLRLLPQANETEKVEFGRTAARLLRLADRSAEAWQLTQTLPQGAELRQSLEQLPVPDAAAHDGSSPFLQLTGRETAAYDPEPALLPRWSEKLVERYAVRSQIDILKDELREQGRGLIPTMQPLAVGSLVAFRTLRSLQVRNLMTGKTVWERRMQGSPEELLTTTDETDEFNGNQLRLSQGSMVEHHPLVSLAYRDQVYGSLSSDGARLFAVESTGEAALSVPMRVWQMQVDGPGVATPWETNELTAYDLQTGVIRWRVGGVEIEREFSRPLAGTHFFSAPTPSGTELYIIGERHGEVSLFCLSAQTGEELWSQPLAAPGRPIKADLVRSQWACQPALSDGLIVCPTTCGWLTAVDRMTHRLKWTSRFSPRLEQQERFRNGYSVQPLQELNRRWQPAMTLIAHGKVLATPPEMPDEFGMTQPMLFCLNLQTGETLWEQPKAERSGGVGLYLAGVWNEQAVIVGTTSVIGRSLEKGGDVLWSVPLPQRPSGRGIIVNHTLLLPVTGAGLLKINLKSAAIDQTWLPAVEGDIGNLKLHQGQLIAASYQSIAVLPADAQATNPETSPEQIVRSKARQAKLLLVNEQYAELESLLQEVLQSASLTDELRQELLETQRAGLMQQLHTSSLSMTATDKILSQLQQLARTPQQKRDYQRERADHLLQGADFNATLTAYLDILEQFPLNERVVDETRTVRIDSWIGGRLRQLFDANTEEIQNQQFHEQVRLRLKKLPDDVIVKDRWARALSFDVTGLELELELAANDLKQGVTAAGLLRLCRVADADNTALRPQALIQLATALARQGWQQDALECWQRLQQLPDLALPGGETTTELAAAGIAAVQQSLKIQPARQDLWQGPWALERVGVSGNERNLDLVSVVGNGFRALEALRFEQETEVTRIRIEDRPTGAFLASFPLRSNYALEFNSNVGARLLNSLALVVHRGVLHALAWPDRQIIWTWNSDVQGQALMRLALVQPNLNFSLQPLNQFAAIRQSYGNRHQTGYLLLAGPRVLLLHCKDWIALDPLTGEELWRDRSIAERGMAQELGADWLITSTRGGRNVRSVIDGQPRTVTEKTELFSRTIALLDQDLIVINRNSRKAAQAPMVELQRLTPTGTVCWSVPVPQDALLGLPDGQSLIWLTPESELQLIDLHTGEQTEMGKLPAVTNRPRASVSALADQQRIYIFVDSGDSQPMYVNIPAIRFAGQILAFDRQGQPLWSYETPHIKTPGEAADSPAEKPAATSQTHGRRWPLNVLIDDFSECPLLLLVGDRQDRKADLYFHQIRVLGLDKATGQPLVDWERPSESGGFSFLHLDPEQQSIELRTYNERLQLKSRGPLQSAPEPPQ